MADGRAGTNGEVVNTWLKENGFQSRPDLTEFFDYYVKKKWGFVAFKFVGNEELAAIEEPPEDKKEGEYAADLRPLDVQRSQPKRQSSPATA